MRLDAITLEHFRNYAHQSVTFDPSVNVIVGENAQGKTNLLEAAVYLSCAKSPRARTEKEMISFEADAARLTGSVFSRGRDFTVEIELSRGKRRKMSVNQVPCKRAGDLSGVLNTVYFCPDDLLLIRDGAAARRRFMDLSLSQLRPRYDAALREYDGSKPLFLVASLLNPHEICEYGRNETLQYGELAPFSPSVLYPLSIISLHMFIKRSSARLILVTSDCFFR